MGILLTNEDTFSCEDPNIDKGGFIANLIKAFEKSRVLDDTVFRTPTFYDPSTASGQLFHLLWSNEFDSEVISKHFPWMTQRQYEALTNFSYILSSASPDNSVDLVQLGKEFGEGNYSWIGLFLENLNPLVYDESSLDKFHSDYVSTFDFERQKREFTYFKKYYKPKLKYDPNQIEQMIKAGQVDSQIIRIDSPKIAHESIHVHFAPKSPKRALNIDGSWKHEVSDFTISNAACETLSKWGFLLPDKYYKV